MKNSIFLLLLISSIIRGQSKYEKEYRLNEKEVPLKALNFIQQIANKKRLKWYREESSDGESIEAKFKIAKIKYSIEFDTIGKIEDVEETIELSALEATLNSKINKQLEKTFKKYKVIKTQKQLKGEGQELILYFKKETKDFISGYELVVKGSTEKEVNLYEFFFNKKGVLTSQRRIIIKSSVHLEY